MLFWLQVGELLHSDDYGKLINEVPNCPPDVKSDKDKDSNSDKASLKSQGKRRSNPEVDIVPEPSPMKESGSEHGYTTATASGSKDHDHAKEKEGEKWRESKLGRKVRGMENEEDMIKQRAEMRGLIEKKTYIGLVSQLTCTIRL
jgi:hypothetical protein